MNNTAQFFESAKLTKEKVDIHELINFDILDDTFVKVSIVVPVYNSEQFLRECLESCVNQTLKEIEIICVNDGSTDDSLQIIKEYAEKDKRVKIINKENAGYGHSMNIGMDMAKGKYIGIVESDDFAEYNMYELLYDAAEKNDVDFVKGDFYRFIEIDGKYERRYLRSAYNSYYNRVIDPCEDFEAFHFNMQTWSGIYKTSFLKENNIRHNETPGASFQDNGFYFCTYCNAKSIFYINSPVYNYRFDNPNSSVHNKGKTDMIKREFDYILDYIKNNCLNEIYIGLYYWKKFKSYLYTVERIAYELKQDFFFEFCAEYKSLLNENALSEKFFGKNDWETLLWITENPEEYYDIRIKKQKITVIIPVFNVENYLEECLESVISQSLTEIEIICIDDGSTDSSLKKLKNFAQKDKRIQVYNQSNAGVGITRNKGIDMAHGEFVIFMDPDDFYPDKNVLKVLYENAVNNNVLISGGSFSDLVNGNISTSYGKSLSGYIFDFDGLIEYKDYQFDFGFHRFIYNTQMLRENKIYFPDLKRFQDPPFFIKAMIQSGSFYASRKTVYCYRRNSHPMVWTAVKLKDALNGVLTNLKLSAAYGYSKLHSYTVYRLLTSFKNPICDVVKFDDYELIQLISDLNSAISQELIDDEIIESFREDILWVTLLKEFSVRSQKKNISCENVMQKLSTIDKDIKNIRNDIRQSQSNFTEITLIRSSLSFKIGRLITWLPRQIRRVLRGKNK